ncbi:MAG TPA: cysteine--tRNA ligase [Candidatus Azoamicus sp. OHIO1]
MLKIYNTLEKKKEYFYNIENTIKIYVCGVTVHDYCHIGHARIFIFFDFVIRYFKTLNYKIIFVRNITDIDDKIINKALIKKTSTKKISEKYTYKMYADLKKLNIIEPTFEPKATNFVKNMIEIINKLKIKNYAYKGYNNDIYYNISKNKNYGNLSNKNLIRVMPVNRIKINNNKKSNLDFALWKISNTKKNSWKSPWGIGRPGWHTECVAMSYYYFKKTIDIHGGGKDLLFPHHENELAQYKSINNKNLAKIWMHIGFVNIKNTKMSKSLKNSISIKRMVKNIHEEYLRFFMLSTHYKKNIEYSENNIDKAKHSLNNLYKSLTKAETKQTLLNTINKISKTKLEVDFYNAINNDFNSPKALAILFQIADEINKSKDYNEKNEFITLLKHLGNILGILKERPTTFLNINNRNIKNIKRIEKLIHKRNVARKLKNWTLADNIRNKLKKLNVQLKDNKIEIFLKEI